jgi:hypothetical protein
MACAGRRIEERAAGFQPAAFLPFFESTPVYTGLMEFPVIQRIGTAIRTQRVARPECTGGIEPLRCAQE